MHACACVGLRVSTCGGRGWMASTWSLSHWHSGREMESENHNRFSSSCHLPIPFQPTIRCPLETGGNGSSPAPLVLQQLCVAPVPRRPAGGRPVVAGASGPDPWPSCAGQKPGCRAATSLHTSAGTSRPGRCGGSAPLCLAWRWLSCSASSLWGPLSAWSNREDTA